MQRGLTLIEVMVVIGIFSLILLFGLVIDLGSLKRNTFRGEQSTLVSVLQKARSRSMNNMFGVTHGVCYIAPNYVIFRTATCDLSGVNERVPADTNIASLSNFATTLSPANAVIFDQLTGKTAAVTINMTDGIKSADIKINNEGTINW